MYVNDVTKHEGTERKQHLLHKALTETIAGQPIIML